MCPLSCNIFWYCCRNKWCSAPAACWWCRVGYSVRTDRTRPAHERDLHLSWSRRLQTLSRRRQALVSPLMWPPQESPLGPPQESPLKPPLPVGRSRGRNALSRCCLAFGTSLMPPPQESPAGSGPPLSLRRRRRRQALGRRLQALGRRGQALRCLRQALSRRKQALRSGPTQRRPWAQALGCFGEAHPWPSWAGVASPAVELGVLRGEYFLQRILETHLNKAVMST